MKRRDLQQVFDHQQLAASPRILEGSSYRDLSTVWVVTSRNDYLHLKTVSHLMGLVRPLNHRTWGPIFTARYEVADAYNSSVEFILKDPRLMECTYLFTSESDNLMPHDALIRLQESIGDYDGVAGLYFVKGERGPAMIFGHPDRPGDFSTQTPVRDSIHPCNGIPMGCSLFKMDLFRKMSPPWFKTVQTAGQQCGQDVYFCRRAAEELKAKFAVDTRIAVGHLDLQTGVIW